MKPRLSYANVTSSIALFVALGGVSYAATALPVNSVGNAQIKDAAVTGSKIANSTITSQKLNASAVKALQGQIGERGPLGPKGETGAAGAQGPQGVQGTPGKDGAAGGLGPTYELAATEELKFTLGNATCSTNDPGAWHGCQFTAAPSGPRDMSAIEVPQGNYLVIRSQPSRVSDVQLYKDGSYFSGSTRGVGSRSCELLDAAGNTVEVITKNEDPTDGVAKPSLVTVTQSGRIRLNCSGEISPTGLSYYTLGGVFGGTLEVRLYAYPGNLSLIAVGPRHA